MYIMNDIRYSVLFFTFVRHYNSYLGVIFTNASFADKCVVTDNKT